MTLTDSLDSIAADASRGSGGRPRVLIVDDDETLLRSMNRMLRGRFDVQCESNPYRALVALEDDGPFAVIVSDLTMPGVDGIDFLEQAHAEAPETPRILLTGNATLPASIEAVNRAHVTSFLTKPIAPDELVAYIDEAVRHHDELVGQFDDGAAILEGSADALLETLAIANPTAHTLTCRVTSLVGRYLERHPRGDGWEISMAANMCYLGSAALGADLSTRLLAGDDLGEAEDLLVGCVAAFTVDIVARIPRLANVEEILRHHRHDANDDVFGRAPFGAHLLHIATALAELEISEDSPTTVARALLARAGEFDRPLLREVLEVYLPGAAAEIHLGPDGDIIDLGDR